MKTLTLTFSDDGSREKHLTVEFNPPEGTPMLKQIAEDVVNLISARSAEFEELTIQ